MISPLSITNQYILQPALLDGHRATLNWLSSSVLWKRELRFFQDLLDKYAPRFTTQDDKKKIGHFQNIVLYYRDELVDSLASRLRMHEAKLAKMLESKNESDVEYYHEHNTLMGEMESFVRQFNQHKVELFSFIEKAV
jgi:hypothetical protein